MDWGLPLRLAAGYALLFGAVFTVLLFTGAAVARDFMVQDYPPAIRERYGPKSRRGRQVTAVVAALLGILVVALPVVAMLDLHDRTGAALGFWPGFVFGVVVMVVLNLYDLLILDWLVFCTLRPAFFMLPGTEDMPEYRDYAFHWKVLFPGPIFLIPGYGLAIGLGTLLVEALA